MSPKIVKHKPLELPRTWLDDVLEASSEAETPRAFVFWGALVTIGASTKRQIFLPRGNVYNLYPNMYVLLIAESGLGKEFPIRLSKTLLKESGQTRVISGTSSIQGLVSVLGKAKTLETGTIVKNAEAAFITGEFVNFLLDDALAFTTLMDWYDTHHHDEWDKSLKNENFFLRNIFTSFLGATNLDLFNERVPVKDIRGGFMGRLLPIQEKEVSHLNPLVDESVPIDFKKLSERLTEVSKLSGKFTYEDSAREMYRDWYMDFYNPETKKADKARFVNRIRDHILKVAMNLSLAYKDELVLQERDIGAAINLCEPILKTVIEITEDMGASKFKSHNAMIIQQLIHAKDHFIPRTKLIAANKGELSVKDFTEVINTLIEGDYVESGERNGVMGYRLTQTCIEQLGKVVKGENTKKKQT